MMFIQPHALISVPPSSRNAQTSVPSPLALSSASGVYGSHSVMKRITRQIRWPLGAS